MSLKASGIAEQLTNLESLSVEYDVDDRALEPDKSRCMDEFLMNCKALQELTLIGPPIPREEGVYTHLGRTL